MPTLAPRAVVEAASTLILGKRSRLELALTCLIAGGHLLIEDVPGTGKTTLAHVMAQLFGLDFRRVQFTSDLLPADILGVSVFERDSGVFRFHPGPVFTQVLLADEVNRATPRTQSALLEAMEEHQVSVEGETRRLPEPFFVIATQNPASQIGTYPLPESQLDRFMMRITMGYPDPAAERALLTGRDRRSLLADLAPVADAVTLTQWRAEAESLHVADALIDYVQALIAHTRSSGAWRLGLSPRAGLALLAAARAHARVFDRAHVLPEDVQAVLPAVALHRLPALEQGSPDDAARALLQAVALPA
ncbi:MAG: AAA family ATPase [Methyloversatilis sp.]|uniref:AAA family ATPase n=1 Tax=Methyloversatilis TaxID=378210 RepID=UPI0019C7685F|nr:AAA family ATPase [Methyloversatilis discipulorum]MBC7207335.1 AAA family ATPase [Methyloversatilis sp.]MBT9517963.1 AAA family ATPase [Methyloversatilis discipulorum]